MNTTNTDERSLSDDAVALRVQLERFLIVPAKDWANLRERYAETSEEDRLVLSVYIRHVNTTEPLTVALIQECLDTHIGTFTNWEEARKALGGIFGWPASLDEVDLQDNAGVDITDLLTWSEDGVRNRLQKMLTVVELANALYVFDVPSEDI